jgi:viral A family inclusion protein (fragment)
MQRRFFDVVAIGFVVLLLVFVLYNGKYIQLFNDKFMACSTSHRMSPELNKGALASNTENDFDISDDEYQVSDSSETSALTHESTDVVNSDSSDNSDKSDKSKYLDVDVYDISWGDTLSGISRLTGTSVDELVKLNDISNPNLIYSGSSIKIRQVR